jgi:hypothetical protein
VHFAIDAEQFAVGVDDGGGVAVDAGRFALVHRNDEDDFELGRECAQDFSRLTGNFFREIEVFLLQRFAEVRGVEELFEADDLRALGGRITDASDGRGQRLQPVAGDGVLDESDDDGRSGSHDPNLDRSAPQSDNDIPDIRPCEAGTYEGADRGECRMGVAAREGGRGIDTGVGEGAP